MRFSTICSSALALALTLSDRTDAQTPTATIPIVVAQAMAFEPDMLGRPQYFDGRTPPDWPDALVPAGAKVIGGGVVGNAAMFRMRTAVFAFGSGSKPGDELRAILARDGYTRIDQPPAHNGGGFMETAPTTVATRFCKASVMAMFGPVDSAQAPLVFALNLVDGEGARQSCAPQRAAMTMRRFPVTVPPMTAPKGAVQVNAGSNWGGSGGEMQSILRTSMPADSVLLNYVPQLVAGGWKVEGRPAFVEGLGVQRLSFTEDKEPWTATLIVVSMGERREVLLRVSKVE